MQQKSLHNFFPTFTPNTGPKTEGPGRGREKASDKAS